MNTIEERIEAVHCPLCDKDLNVKQKDLKINWEAYKGKKIPLCAIHPIPKTF